MRTQADAARIDAEIQASGKPLLPCSLCDSEIPADATVCPWCDGDPAATEIRCAECDGEGKVELEIAARGLYAAFRYDSPVYRREICGECGGAGVVPAPWAHLRDEARRIDAEGETA